MAISLDILECPGEVGEGSPVSLEYIAVEARWKGGEGVDASDPYAADETYSEVRARFRLPSIVFYLSAKSAHTHQPSCPETHR